MKLHQFVATLAILALAGYASAQGLRIRHGAPVPIEVKSLYEAGLQYLVKQQASDGTWRSNQYGNGPGVDGLCLTRYALQW